MEWKLSLGWLSLPPQVETLIIVAGSRSLASALRDSGHGVFAVASDPADEMPSRIVAASDLAETHPWLCELAVGVVGLGACAGAALAAAAERPWGIGAVVAIDARLDLPHALLERVRAPTLLLQRTHDWGRVALARVALERLHEYCVLIEYSDKEEAFRQAHAWLNRHLGAAQREAALVH